MIGEQVPATMRGMDYRQWIGYSALMAGLIVVVINYRQGDVALASILLAVLVMLGGLLFWWTRPGRGGLHVSHAEARVAAGDGDVIVYWRPGCIFCDRLKLGLGDTLEEVSWVNIALDPDGAEFVASRHGGNENVPTAVTGAGELIEATPAAIRAQLGLVG